MCLPKPNDDGKERASFARGAAPPAGGRDGADRRPRLSVRSVDGLAVVDIVDAEALFEEDVLCELGAQLHDLVERGQVRLVLNFGGVRTMSSDVLATLAGLHRRVERSRGYLGLCGLNPVLREMLRICHLERALPVYADETDVPGIAPSAGDRPLP
jgi:anti-anti-sigma factor